MLSRIQMIRRSLHVAVTGENSKRLSHYTVGHFNSATKSKKRGDFWTQFPSGIRNFFSLHREYSYLMTIQRNTMILDSQITESIYVALFNQN